MGKFSSFYSLASAAVAEVRLYHREDFAPEAALEVGRLFRSRRDAYEWKREHAGVVYLVDDAVEKFRSCRGLSYDHQGLSCLVARVGEPVVQLSALHVLRGRVEYVVRSAEPPKVPDDLSGPVAAQRYVYSEGPVVLWHVDGPRDHRNSPHSTGMRRKIIFTYQHPMISPSAASASSITILTYAAMLFSSASGLPDMSDFAMFATYT